MSMQATGGRRQPGRVGRDRSGTVRGVCALACIALLVLAGCRQTSTDRPDATAAPAAAANASAQAAPAPVRPASAPLPSADEVLDSIYQPDPGGHVTQGATSVPIANGSVASFWYGDEYEIGGKHYYTGFAYDTPEKYGKSAEEDYPDPQARVTITQATYVLAATGPGKASWTFEGAERFVGEFGAYEKADDIDDTRKAQDATTSDGKRVLAVPTSTFSGGFSTTGFALFVFDPGELADTDDRHWTYLGNVVTGEDNGAACADGDVMPCVSGTGTLSFQPGGDGRMPNVQVVRSGTTIASPGKTRAFGAADTVTYVYDAAKKQYVARAG